jgi:hypothetical protein
MGRYVYVAALAVISLGCGTGSPESLPVGFSNHTKHSTADLWTIWKAAQQSVAQQIDLNPLQTSLHSAPAQILPGDVRALQVMPHQLSVAPRPDVASSALLAATGLDRPDPTGLIPCPQPCNVGYAAAYSEYRPQLTRFAASWEFQGNNFSLILQYEFENHILAALGYDMQWR